jgi:hypothetical protein
MKYPQLMAIESLQIIGLPDDLTESQNATREIADFYLSTNEPATRNSLLDKLDPVLWSCVADTVTDWIMQWWAEGNVRLVHRGTELPQGGRLDCRTNTYTDGFARWSPVQVEWLPEHSLPDTSVGYVEDSVGIVGPSIQSRKEAIRCVVGDGIITVNDTEHTLTFNCSKRELQDAVEEYAPGLKPVSKKAFRKWLNDNEQFLLDEFAISGVELVRWG